MDILDTRDLNDRLNELEDLDSTETEARDILSDIEQALKEAKSEQADMEIKLDTSRTTDIDSEIERVEEALDKINDTVEELKSDFDTAQDKLQEAIMDDSDREELDALRSMKEEISDWDDGCTLIPEIEFEDYCQEMLEDCGDLPKDLASYIVIDWEATSNNLKADYSEIDYQGTTYLYRNC